MYIYLLDGIEFDAPVNDKELITTIKRNANLDGFLITQDADLTFAGNAYTYIYQMFNDDTFCSEIEIEILEECEGGIEEIYKGILKLSSAVFEEDDCTVRVKVQDNSFYSYINNNKSIDISPTQTGTKSGIEISPCSPYDITTFDPETGTLNPNVIEAYRVYDLMEHAVTVMTDGKVGFRSDFLWNQDEELFLTTGNALAEAGNPATFVYSFDKLYSELNKLFNLSFFIEEDLYQTPTLRIEPKDYFYQTSDGISFEDIKSLKVSVDQSKIYGTVILGSSVLSDIQGVFSFNEDTPFYGFKQEKFYPIGQCNLDTELNLVNDYVLSSNVIQDCVMKSAKQYYDQNIFLSCGDVDIANKTADAILYELGGTAPPYIYNLNLNNYNKAQNHFSYINSNLLDSFNVSSENFHAEKATDTVYACGGYPGANYTNIIFQQGGSTPNYNYYEYELYLSQYAFPDESSAGNYDLGGNYDNATYRYTVPTDGRKTFSVKMFYDVVSALNYNEGDPSAQRWEFYVIIQRYDSLLNYIEETVTTNNISRNQGFTVAQLAEGSASFDCNTGDIIQVKIGFFIRLWQSLAPLDPTARCAVKVKSTSFFESNSDNLIVGASNINYKILRYEFQLPLSKADFNTLKADPTGLQTFTKWSEAQQAFRVRRAWIEELKYNNWEQFATVKLIANNAIIQE